MAELAINSEEKKVTTELGYKAKIEIGGTDPSKFAPNINCSFERKLSDEFFINVNAADVLVASEKETIATDGAEIKIGDRTDKYYVDVDNNLEYEIILEKKPASNKINLTVKCSPVLGFHHQPALTQAQIDDGDIRPDDIVNSYAVYCDQENNEYHTGKVAHIKRSWVIDSSKKKSWCAQSIDIDKGVGTWTITIPEKIWEDEKKYPLTIGPTFGYDTQGVSSGTVLNYIRGTSYTGAAGVANDLNASFWSFDAGEKVTAAMYQYSDGALVKVSDEVTGPQDVGFVEFDFSGGDPSITAQDYCLVVSGDSTTYVHLDSVSVNRYYKSVTYPTWPDPFDGTTGPETYKYSIYCNYTASVGGSLEMEVAMHHYTKNIGT